MKRLLSSLLALALTLSSVGAVPLWAANPVEVEVAPGVADGAGVNPSVPVPVQTAVSANQVSAITGQAGAARIILSNSPAAAAAAGALGSSADSGSSSAPTSLTSQASAGPSSAPTAPAAGSLASNAAAAAAPAVPAQSTGVRAAVARLVRSFMGLSDNAPSDSAPSAPAFAYGVIRRPHSPLVVRKNVKVVSKPRPIAEGAVITNRFHLAKDQPAADGSAPIVLNADNNEASIEAALTQLVDSDPAKYGASSADMAKVHVSKLPGTAEGQADSYIAVYRQWKVGKDADGTDYNLMVQGGGITFHVKVLDDGKPVVMGTSGRLYPNISPDIMTPKFNDTQLQGFAEDHMLGTPPGAGPVRQFVARTLARAERAVGVAQDKAPQFITRQISNVGGQWRAVNLYDSTDLKGQSMVVAVDVQTGEAFAWDDRSMIQTGPPAAAASVSGSVVGRGNAVDPADAADDNYQIGPIPLAYLNVYDKHTGQVVGQTDTNGSFTVPYAPDVDPAPMDLYVKLEGKYGKVVDAASGDTPIIAEQTAAPGQTVSFVLNPTSDDETMAANVNTYAAVTTQIDYITNVAQISDPRIQAPLAGDMNTNRTDMVGNAYYDPSVDGIFLMLRGAVDAAAKALRKLWIAAARFVGASPKATMVFENTAKRSIIYHEITHRAVQMMSQLALTAEQAASPAMRFVAKPMDAIMDAGLNEGIADTVSEQIRKNPIVGEGFWLSGLPDGQPNYIRNASLVKQYDPNETEPHAASEPYSESNWDILNGLMQRMGAPAGAAYAAVLVVRTTLNAQPQDMPSALMHYLLSDMKKDGTIPNEDIIRGTAQKHGIPLQASPKPPATAAAPTTPNTPPAA